MTAATPEAANDRIGRPYGLVGLTISFVLILVVSIFLSVLAAALIFALYGLALGWTPALRNIGTLQGALVRHDPGTMQAVNIIGSLTVYAAVAAVVLAAARLRGGARWRDVIAWHGWNPFRRSRLFWIVAVGTIVYSFAAGELVSRLYPPSKDWITLPSQMLWALLFLCLAVVFAPVTEELLFRGWLYTGLRTKIGAWAGIILTSVLFALAHWESTHIYALVVFPVGIALGFIRERTNSLKASITFHAVYNAAATALLALGF